MALEQFVRILWARRWLAIAVLLIVAGAGVGGTMVWPKKYNAVAQVLVDLKATDPVSGLPGGAGSAAATYLATEMDVVRSNRVSLRVVDALRLAENPQLRSEHAAAAATMPLREWISNRLIAQLKLKPSRDSTVLEIGYTGVDARFAAIVANAFARAYIDTNLELRVEPARAQATWFAERSKTLRANLDAAQRRLGDYQRSNRIVSLDERLDVENSRLHELSSQLVALQALSSESAKRAAIAKSAAEAGGASLGELPEVLQSGMVQTMKAELSRFEGRLADVGANLGRNHPDHLKLVEEIESLRRRLDREMRTVASALERTSQLNRQRESEVAAALDRQRSRVIELKAKRDEFTVLTRDVETAQRAFDEVSLRSSKVGLESQLRQTNVVLLDPAVPPADPSSPNLLVNSLASIVVGLLLAVALVLAIELTDRRVRSAADAIEVTGLPVLGHVRSRRTLFRRRQPALAPY